jgi:spermidine synthase
MKPINKIATATTPDGKELILTEHDGYYAISVDRIQLMTSREHESELELARIGCARIAHRRAPTVLIGGLGLGYTVRQALDMLRPDATVLVAELVPDIIRWNRDIVGELADHPMKDERCLVKRADVMDIIRKSDSAFDAILLDVDNGPEAMTTASNHALYGPQGLRACMRALHSRGCLSIWSDRLDGGYKRILKRQGITARFFKVAAHKNAKALSRCIWVAAGDPKSLPSLEDPREQREAAETPAAPPRRPRPDGRRKRK